MGKGEVVGWIRISKTTRSGEDGPRVSYTATVQPLAYSRDAVTKFDRFSGGTAGRIEEACRSRGADPFEHLHRQLPSRPPMPPGWRTTSPSPDPFTSDFSLSNRRILCRLRYAGLFGRVVYDFEEFRPEDEARLRNEVLGYDFDRVTRGKR
jgi:hypothetical protein